MVIKDRESTINKRNELVEQLKSHVEILDGEALERAREYNEVKENFETKINQIMSEREKELIESENNFRKHISVIETSVGKIKEEFLIEKESNRLSLEREREQNNVLLKKIEMHRKQRKFFGLILIFGALILIVIFYLTLNC